MAKFTARSDDAAESAAETPAVSTYHPQAIRALQSVREQLQKLIAQVDAAIIADPPPFVASRTAAAVTVNGSVRSDFADVYATPHINAEVLGQIAQGAVLPVQLD